MSNLEQEKQLREKIKAITVTYDNGFGSLDLAEDEENGGNAIEYILDIVQEAKLEAYKQGYIDGGITQLKEEVSVCCSAPITETGFCTDCWDNC
jgi:hypothetical protein